MLSSDEDLKALIPDVPFLDLKAQAIEQPTFIGAGGQGAVRKQRMRVPKLDGSGTEEKDTAIKSIPLTGATRDTFLREVEFMFDQGQQHPNLVKVFGWSRSEDKSQGFVIMELMDDNLLNFMKNASADVFRANFWKIIQGIAAGLFHMNTHNQLHGDIKPENILIKYEDPVTKTKISRVVLGDFSAVKCLESSVTDRRPMVHSQHYSSPQLLISFYNDSTVSYRQFADVYSFGIVIGECLTRREHVRGQKTVDGYVVNSVADPFSDVALLGAGNDGVATQELIDLYRKCTILSPQSERPTMQQVLEVVWPAYFEERIKPQPILRNPLFGKQGQPQGDPSVQYQQGATVFLNDLPKPVHVISFTGLGRTGKSDVCSRVALALPTIASLHPSHIIQGKITDPSALLKLANCVPDKMVGPFEVSSNGMNPCTSGVDAVAVPRKEGGCYLLLDVEGVKNGQTKNHSQLLAIVYQISSIIFHMHGITIDGIFVEIAADMIAQGLLSGRKNRPRLAFILNRSDYEFPKFFDEIDTRGQGDEFMHDFEFIKRSSAPERVPLFVLPHQKEGRTANPQENYGKELLRILEFILQESRPLDGEILKDTSFGYYVQETTSYITGMPLLTPESKRNLQLMQQLDSFGHDLMNQYDANPMQLNDYLPQDQLDARFEAAMAPFRTQFEERAHQFLAAGGLAVSYLQERRVEFKKLIDSRKSNLENRNNEFGRQIVKQEVQEKVEKSPETESVELAKFVRHHDFGIKEEIADVHTFTHVETTFQRVVTTYKNGSVIESQWQVYGEPKVVSRSENRNQDIRTIAAVKKPEQEVRRFLKKLF